MMPNIDSIIRDHVTLTVRCLDRIYLQGYMPKLQTSGALCYFLRDHLGQPIPSPALFRPMHDRFVAAVKTFAADHAVPLIEFESGQDKDAIVAAHRARFRGEDGVVTATLAWVRVLPHPRRGVLRVLRDSPPRPDFLSPWP